MIPETAGSVLSSVTVVLGGKELSMDVQPDFDRFRTVVNHQEADRVPLCEALVGYGIMSKFLDR